MSGPVAAAVYFSALLTRHECVACSRVNQYLGWVLKNRVFQLHVLITKMIKIKHGLNWFWISFALDKYYQYTVGVLTFHQDFTK